MRILVAPDKFKGSLGAAAVAESIGAGLREALPSAEIILLPIADGGEGTAAVICAAAGGDWQVCQAHDPLGNLVSARYCTIAGGTAAVLEMSEASGLWRVLQEGRNPMKASSLGTGEMLLEARRRGAQRIVIGLGGSATNDGGFGMARALGFRFLHGDGRELCGAVSDLLRLDHISPPAEAWRLPIIAAADVSNPLLGARGATRTYARQKGATPDQVELLERSLARLADIVAQDLGCDHRDVAGAGAAGGLGFGLMSFCGGQSSGFDVVAEAVGLRAQIARADIVITGEGKLDEQTLAGKAPAGVARLARAEGKPVFAIVGSANENARALFDRVLALAEPPVTEREAMADAANLLRRRAHDLARSLR